MGDVKRSVQQEAIDKIEGAIANNVKQEATHLQLDPTPKDAKKESDLVIAGTPSVGENIVGKKFKLKFEFAEEQPEATKTKDGTWLIESEFEFQPLSPRKREMAIWSFVELAKLFGTDSLSTILKHAREDYVTFIRFDDLMSMLLLTLLGRDPSESEHLQLGSGTEAFMALLESNPNLITEIESFLGIQDRISP